MAGFASRESAHGSMLTRVFSVNQKRQNSTFVPAGMELRSTNRSGPRKRSWGSPDGQRRDTELVGFRRRRLRAERSTLPPEPWWRQVPIREIDLMGIVPARLWDRSAQTHGAVQSASSDA